MRMGDTIMFLPFILPLLGCDLDSGCQVVHLNSSSPRSAIRATEPVATLRPHQEIVQLIHRMPNMIPSFYIHVWPQTK